MAVIDHGLTPVGEEQYRDIWADGYACQRRIQARHTVEFDTHLFRVVYAGSGYLARTEWSPQMVSRAIREHNTQARLDVR